MVAMDRMAQSRGHMKQSRGQEARCVIARTTYKVEYAGHDLGRETPQRLYLLWFHLVEDHLGGVHGLLVWMPRGFFSLFFFALNADGRNEASVAFSSLSLSFLSLLSLSGPFPGRSCSGPQPGTWASGGENKVGGICLGSVGGEDKEEMQTRPCHGTPFCAGLFFFKLSTAIGAKGNNAKGSEALSKEKKGWERHA